jgi:hypothetical protein
LHLIAYLSTNNLITWEKRKQKKKLKKKNKSGDTIEVKEIREGRRLVTALPLKNRQQIFF